MGPVRRLGRVLGVAIAGAALLQGCAALPGAEIASVRPAAPPVKDEDTGFRPESLVGLSAIEISGRFGPPALIRRETPVELWQYRSARCVMDVVIQPGRAPLKPTGAGATPATFAVGRVVHAEIRGRDIAEISPEDCARALSLAAGTNRGAGPARL